MELHALLHCGIATWLHEALRRGLWGLHSPSSPLPTKATVPYLPYTPRRWKKNTIHLTDNSKATPDLYHSIICNVPSLDIWTDMSLREYRWGDEQETWRPLLKKQSLRLRAALWASLGCGCEEGVVDHPVRDCWLSAHFTPQRPWAHTIGDMSPLTLGTYTKP